MLPDLVLQRFVEACPAAVMVRATLERLLRAERLDGIFQAACERQYASRLLFSDVVAVMTAVATRERGSVHAAYLAMREKLGVSAAALYGKLNRLEPGVSAALVRETAADAAAVIDEMPEGKRTVLKGFHVQYVDGNHLSSTEHRLAALRTTRQGPLPGQTLAVLDAQRDLIVELIPCEDGHAQERSLLPALLERTRRRTLTVADRNFCTTMFLFGLIRRWAYFVVRQHASTLHWRLVGRRRRIGRTETGTVHEQQVELTDGDERRTIRRITVKLDSPTENGDTEIHLLTNLTPRQADALQVARLYRTRWTIEGAFQTLTDVLRCEVETLGYPRAALFSFAVAVLACNTLAVTKAALRSAHGTENVDEKLSLHHLTQDVAATHVGLDIAVPPQAWERYPDMPPRSFAQELVRLAARVDLARYPRKPRGPKKPRPADRKSGRRNHHVATARLLAESRRK